MPATGASPVYEIRVRGHFAPHWCEVFQPLDAASADGGVTVLRGQIADQAALHGVLRRLERSGIVLLSLACVDDEDARSARV
jgi:hypothetical protein